MKAEFITIDDVAKYLKLNKQKLYQLAQRGNIPAYKFGREWRFKTDRLDQWIEEQEVSNKIKSKQNR
jgi:excisionase family DNA binding protein